MEGRPSFFFEECGFVGGPISLQSVRSQMGA